MHVSCHCVLIKKLNNDFKNNIIAKAILRDIVINFLYMFKVDYKNKQQLSEELGFPIEKQLLNQKGIKD